MLNDIAILLTVHNRKAKTLACLDSVATTLSDVSDGLSVNIYLTDDGSTDGTAEAIRARQYPFSIHLLKGDGDLFWNGGMINSWQAAQGAGTAYDGYLWLNNDTTILPNFWSQLQEADAYSRLHSGRGGIYVGSTCASDGHTFSYGGFNFVNRLTLKDRFVEPNGTFQPCQCAHGNLTFVSADVVKQMGIFTNEYIHSGGDHDYTYRSYKKGFLLLVLPSFVGVCDNNHPEDGYADFLRMPLRERLAYLKSPLGFNLHNTLTFQRRCFPYRYPFVWLAGHLKALFPYTYWSAYKWLRR